MNKVQGIGSERRALAIDKVIATTCILIYAVVVPVLELNATHVFDPLWPAHARLHEVWQLSTNSALGMWGLWLVWSHGNIRLPSMLALSITGGFLFAYAMRWVYDGSMVLSDGSEKMINGANLGLLTFGLVACVASLQLARSQKYRLASGASFAARLD